MQNSNKQLFLSCENGKIKVFYAKRTNVNSFFTNFHLPMAHIPYAISRYHYATQNYPILLTVLVIKASIRANKQSNS